MVTVERGGFGADAAAPAARDILEPDFDVNGARVEEVEPPRGRHRSNEPPCRHTQPSLRRFDERSAGLVERTGFLRMDPLIAFAGIGLIACSVIALGGHRGDDLGNDYYVIRQSIYAVIGIALMFALARIDYSRFRELRVGIYAAMIFIDHRSSSFVAVDSARRRSAGSSSPSSRFQPSELGKLLLILALAGFVIDRARRQTEWQRTARLLLLGLLPAAIVFVQPDLGTALVYGAVTLAILFIAGIRWTHFAALGGLALAAVDDRARGRPGGRTAGASGLPAGAADVVPQSE